MKKIVALLLTSLLILSVFSFVSCSNEKEENTETQKQTTNEEQTSTDNSEVDAVIKRIEKIGELTSENYSSFKATIELARNAYNKLTDEQKTMIDASLMEKLAQAEEAYSTFENAAKSAEALTVNRLILATPTIDGEIDAEYLMGTNLTLSKSAIEAFTDEQKSAGGTIVYQDDNIISDNTEVTFYFALDNEYIYICEKRIDETPAYTASSYKQPYTGDGSIIWFTKNGAETYGLMWNYATKDSDKPQIALFSGDDQTNAELKDYTVSSRADTECRVLEVAIPLSDIGLTKNDFSEKTVGLTFCAVDVVDKGFDGDASKLWNSTAYQMQYPGVNSFENAQRFYIAAASDYNYISTGTPSVDGKVDDLYNQQEAFELNKEICANFTDDEKEIGAGMVGDTEMGEISDTRVIFRFAVDKENIYIIEELHDKTLMYSAQTFRQPYAGDGALIWFTKDGELGAGLQWNIATQESEEPQIGLFINDDQNNSVLKEYECATYNDKSAGAIFLEVKIPLSDLNLTYSDFENGAVGMTFCCVDIIDIAFSGDTTELWENIGYQMQYPGVNSWDNATRLLIK